ncbi:MAG: endonuclease [Oligoflexia bacterium]|nr:endonuclease [Oligoflexia bacterium]
MKLVFLFAVLIWTSQSFAYAAGVEGYYGRDFSRYLKNRSTQLKPYLKSVLRERHQKNRDGYDRIVKTCEDENCFLHKPISYEEARKYILGDFYLVPMNNKGYGLYDVYCDRVKAPNEFRHKPAPGEVPDNNIINVEHTWPQSKFSRRFQEGWQKADLHHLYPSDSQMNSRRSSYPFGEVREPKSGLKCDNSKLGPSMNGSEIVFEPPQGHKGNVARSLLYFSLRYDMQISKEEEDVLKKWNLQDPPDESEKERNEKIFKIQGNRNPLVDFPEIASIIEDF